MSISNNQTQIQEECKTQVLSSWLVIIYDDPINLMDYVTRIIQKVLGYPKEKAKELMLQVHHNGKAIVWSGSKEKSRVLCAAIAYLSIKCLARSRMKIAPTLQGGLRIDIESLLDWASLVHHHRCCQTGRLTGSFSGLKNGNG